MINVIVAFPKIENAKSIKKYTCAQWISCRCSSHNRGSGIAVCEFVRWRYIGLQSKICGHDVYRTA